MSLSSDNYLLTIVMPVLNGEKYIQEALESVKNEKLFSPIELIVVDAASTDGTLEIVKKYLDTVDVLISEPDDGQSSAYNKAFDIAKGDYLMWLQADDVIIKNSFEGLFDLLNSGKHLWITFNTIIISEKNVPIKFISGITPPKFLKTTHYHFVDSPSSIFHRSIYKNVGPVNESLHFAMDVEYWYRILEAGYSFKRYNEYVYGFRMHKTSKTGSKGYGSKNKSKPFISQRSIESKYIQEKYGLTSHSLYSYFVIKLLKLRFARLKDFVNLFFKREIE
jgi:glycosyltransferase involved in cell wall biosynthesis